MTNIDKIKLGAGLVAGFAVPCLIGAVVAPSVVNTTGIKKVGCAIGTALIAGWATSQVNKMVDEKIDNAVLIAQKVIERQNELQKKKEEKEKENKDDDKNGK